MDKSFEVVVAIDFGTSRSGFAYKFKEWEESVFRDLWPDSPISYPKTATHLLLSPEGEVEAWGYTAMKKLAELRAKKIAKDYYFARNFKMELHSGKKDKDGPYIINENNGSKIPVIDLIADYIRLIKDEALKEIKNSTSGELKDEEIRWCLTIPAIWKDADKDLMRRAAQKAGLIGSSEDEAERLFLVLEPEAAAIFCQEVDKNTLTPGTKIMIVDCGGGTIDITVHEVVKDGGLDEVTTGTGGAFGSMYVDKSFLEYLQEKLTAEMIELFQETEPVDYLQMLEDWERTKCGFDPETSGDVVYFPIRTKLYNLISNQEPQVLEDLADEQNGDDTNIYLSRERMESIFRPTLDGLVSTVENQFRGLKDKDIDIIFLVGGFSTSPLLRQRIKEEFEERVKKIVMPPRPGVAILKGAASFGVNPSIIRARCSRLTYGVSLTPTFIPGVHPESKKIWAEDLKKYLCMDGFGTLVHMGQKVPTDAEITIEFKPADRNQKAMDFEFFSSPQEDVDYTDEPAVTKLGELLVEMPFTTGGLDRVVEMTFYFGQTEIKVKAIDRTSGNEYKSSIRFSSGY
ncbi:MAG: chaperone protein [Oscillatoriales cyanobacterium]|uniref:Hsp70 family protein n=1 Tax=unclassified Microcoleus TaxID=2642155 RepID=UPI001D8561EC|nr:MULTISPECIES: Hsp70 family protein [unclassified Microcoleus]TAG90088.1 MAG: chaperone protein [Oscillatoriales cyanobacterium]MCC3568578.1 HSP70 family protein [Microcoleus sp. PH2017_31_RDM_U_A]MCC3580854.1 HSP70 family protein [Microcoleus sp. PH2017_32_RDM_D_A]MCC3618963.1 HSP70 family protein [Microcoleus sp. PH2017_38_RDM_U_B]TAH17188.1 MAG: chaperone protein [Oscillatoriales cyanobacterium]